MCAFGHEALREALTRPGVVCVCKREFAKDSTILIGYEMGSQKENEMTLWEAL